MKLYAIFGIFRRKLRALYADGKGWEVNGDNSMLEKIKKGGFIYVFNKFVYSFQCC